MFVLRDVWFSYPDAEAPALRDVNVAFEPGVHSAVVGPNGAGKSTLLRVMMGRLLPGQGEALFEDRVAADWSRREMARRVAVVGQEPAPDFPLTVREFVDLGRHPYLASWAPLTPRDHEVVESAMERASVSELADRDVGSLSAGELQRAKISRALAQEPRVFVLDEPTAHLDLGHEMQVFELLHELIVENGLTAISVTHNLNLAGRFATHLVLLAEGTAAASGPAPDVLTPERIEGAFGWPVRVRADESGLQVIPR